MMLLHRCWAHLRKECREQRVVLLGVPASTAVVAVFIHQVVDTRELVWLPQVLLAVAVVSTSIVFGTDLFGGEIRGRSGAFLARSPRAVSASVLAKLVVLGGAIVAHGWLAWQAGYWALGDGLAQAIVAERTERPGIRVVDAALHWPWLFAGVVFWLATVACLVRQAGSSLVLAFVPVGVLFAACAYGLRGVELTHGHLVPEVWWWTPWAAILAPAGLVLVYRLRLLCDTDPRAWMVAAGVLVVPMTGMWSIVSDWQRFDPREGATSMSVGISSDRTHAFVIAGVEKELGKTQYALVFDLEMGRFEQRGGPGAYWLPEPGLHRWGQPLAGATLMPAERWHDASGRIAVRTPPRFERQQMTFAQQRWPAPAPVRIQRGANGMAQLVLEGDRSWTFGFGRQPLPGLSLSFYNPFCWRIHRGGALKHRLDSICGRVMPAQFAASENRIGLVVGPGWIVGPRSIEESSHVEPPVLIDRTTHEPRPIPGLRPGETVGFVLDPTRVALGRIDRQYPQAWSTALHGWLDVTTGERGPLAWSPEDAPRTPSDAYRGTNPRNLLLVTRRPGEPGFELAWDDGDRVARVPFDDWPGICLWDGGDSALVQVDLDLLRVHVDGRREVVFSLRSSRRDS